MEKHNASFDYSTGEAKGTPACINLCTYPVQIVGGMIRLVIDRGILHGKPDLRTVEHIIVWGHPLRTLLRVAETGTLQRLFFR